MRNVTKMFHGKSIGKKGKNNSLLFNINFKNHQFFHFFFFFFNNMNLFLPFYYFYLYFLFIYFSIYRKKKKI